MILTHLFLQRLQCFRAQIPREVLGGEWQNVNGVSQVRANQSSPLKLSTVLVRVRVTRVSLEGYLCQAHEQNTRNLTMLPLHPRA